MTPSAPSSKTDDRPPPHASPFQFADQRRRRIQPRQASGGGVSIGVRGRRACLRRVPCSNGGQGGPSFAVPTATVARAEDVGSVVTKENTVAKEGGMSDVIVTTMNDLPGYRVTQVYGEVFSLTFAVGTSSRSWRPPGRPREGEIEGYEDAADSRIQQSTGSATRRARPGQTAVIAMRFDCNELEQRRRGRGVPNSHEHPAS